MPLADNIAKLRDLILADLDAVLDYDANTQAVWRMGDVETAFTCEWSES